MRGEQGLRVGQVKLWRFISPRRNTLIGQVTTSDLDAMRRRLAGSLVPGETRKGSSESARSPDQKSHLERSLTGRVARARAVAPNSAGVLPSISGVISGPLGVEITNNE